MNKDSYCSVIISNVDISAAKQSSDMKERSKKWTSELREPVGDVLCSYDEFITSKEPIKGERNKENT